MFSCRFINDSAYIQEPLILKNRICNICRHLQLYSKMIQSCVSLDDCFNTNYYNKFDCFRPSIKILKMFFETKMFTLIIPGSAYKYTKIVCVLSQNTSSKFFEHIITKFVLKRFGREKQENGSAPKNAVFIASKPFFIWAS